jgi:hypothetical protein
MDEEDESPEAGPIAKGIGANINEQHIDRGLSVAEKLADGFSQRGHKQNMARVILNYVALIAISGILAWLNFQGTMPAEALTGFLGTGIGYWLATSRQR